PLCENVDTEVLKTKAILPLRPLVHFSADVLLRFRVNIQHHGQLHKEDERTYYDYRNKHIPFPITFEAFLHFNNFSGGNITFSTFKKVKFYVFILHKSYAKPQAYLFRCLQV